MRKRTLLRSLLVAALITICGSAIVDTARMKDGPVCIPFIDCVR